MKTVADLFFLQFADEQFKGSPKFHALTLGQVARTNSFPTDTGSRRREQHWGNYETDLLVVTRLCSHDPFNFDCP